MKMLNGNLCCELVTKEVVKGGVVMSPSNQSYKTLKVSEGVEIDGGKTILVPITSGTEVEINGDPRVIVNIREVILILD